MAELYVNRRMFFGQAGGIAAAGLVPSLANKAHADEAPSPLVRKSVAEFVKDAKALKSLRAAVKKMADLPPRNPFSWIFQANIHGRPLYPNYVYKQADKSDDPGARLFRDDTGFTPDPNKFSFSQCPHGNWWFLPWHRAYLHYFERILRWAAGDPKLTLPYWNYCDPSQRELPQAFRESKVAGAANPLYLPDSVTFTDEAGQQQVFPVRDAALNQGLAQLTESAAGTAALAVLTFTNSAPNPSNQGFGSPRACDATCACGFGALENTPHNKIHTALGGNQVSVAGGFRVGFMGDVPTAARDPIFWLHHCNIDRLWESWLALGKGRANPQDSEWLDYPFTFYDVGSDNYPKLVTLTTRDLLTPKSLGYRYDKLETLPATVVVRSPVVVLGKSFLPLATTAKPEKPARPGEKPHMKKQEGIRLSNTTSKSVDVPLSKDVTPDRVRKAVAGKPAEQEELQLALEGVEFEQMPGVYYEVYLNLPPAAKATPASRYYLGSLTFFGLHQHGAAHGGGSRQAPRTFRFAIPPQLKKLIAEKKLDPGKLQVTFTPQTGTKAVRAGVKLKAPEERTSVTIKRVRLLVVR